MQELLIISFSVVVFICGYVLIALEHKTNINKSAVALAMAGILWLLVVFSGLDKNILAHSLEVAGSEIFSIIVFLLAAMTLIEILIHYNFFDWLQQKIAERGLDDNKQFIVIAGMTFFLSALFDNLTITIVMIQMARRFFKGKNLLTAVCGIVILANAGGAWSPIGDVTTIMIWLAGKFSAREIIQYAFLPSFALGCVATYLLSRSIVKDTRDKQEKSIPPFSGGEKMVIGLTIASFALPLMMSVVGLPPYMGLLLGLGIVWSLIEYLQVRSPVRTHLEASIESLMRKADISSLKFFIGTLLSVGALKTFGILDRFSIILFGIEQEVGRVIVGSMMLGLLSAIVDNVPLTAIAIDIIQTHNPQIWVLLAIAAGTGGSLLSVGSVAGVIAVGMVKELNFQRYLQIALIPALLGYISAMAVWFIQYNLL